MSNICKNFLTCFHNNHEKLENKIKVKKALLIGINYENTNYELNGCINDTLNLNNFLIKNHFFINDEIIIMNDNKKEELYPNKKNILFQLNQLHEFSKKNKDKIVQFFISFSGHGYHQIDENGDESNGYDEVLCPIDFLHNGYIIDDYIKKEFIDKLNYNVSCVCLMDCCHSGTIMDLKYNYKLNKNKFIYSKSKNIRTKCNIVMISGCRDNQTSSDALLIDKNKEYQFQGALTSSFINSFEYNINYKDLIIKIRENIKKYNFDQLPQLSSGKKLKLNDIFLISEYN